MTEQKAKKPSLKNALFLVEPILWPLAFLSVCRALPLEAGEEKLGKH